MQAGKKNDAKIYRLLLAVLILFQIIANAVVIYQDTFPLTHESGRYYAFSLIFYNSIRGQKFDRVFTSDTDNKGPFFFLSTLPFFYFFGLNEKSIKLTNMAYLLAALIAAYLIGKDITRSEKGGFYCAFFLSFMPCFFPLSRAYFMEFPMIAWMIIYISMQIRSDFFNNTFYTILLAIVLSFGILMKVYSLIMVALPLVYFVFIALKTKRNIKKRIRNLTLLCLIILLLSLPFYWIKLINLFKDVSDLMVPRGSALGIPLYDQIIMYPSAWWLWLLVNPLYRILIVISAACLACSFVLNSKKMDKRYLFLILLMTLGSYIFFALIYPPKHPANSFFLTPGLGLLVGLGFFELDRLKKARILIAIACILCILNFIILSYYPQLMPSSIRYPEFESIFDKEINGALYATHYDWKIIDALKIMNDSVNATEKRRYNVLFIENMGFYSSFFPNSIVLGMPLEFNIPTSCPEGYHNERCDFDYSAQVRSADIIIKMDEEKPFFREINAVANSEEDYEKLKNEFDNSLVNLKLIGAVDIPFNMTMFIYRNTLPDKK